MFSDRRLLPSVFGRVPRAVLILGFLSSGPAAATDYAVTTLGDNGTSLRTAITSVSGGVDGSPGNDRIVFGPGPEAMDPFSGGLTVNGGTLSLDQDSPALTVGTTLFVDTLDNAAVQINSNLPGTGRIAFSGGGAITKTGPDTLAFVGTDVSNTFTGGFTFQEGTVSVVQASQLGTGGLTLNGGTLEAAGTFTTTLGVTLTTIGGSSGTLSTAPGVTATFAGAIAGAAGTGTLTKAGTGTLVLSGGNSYAGGTILNAGILRVTTSDSALGIGALTAGAAGVELEFGDSRTLGNALVMANNLVVDTGANAVGLTGTISGAGLLTKTGTGTLTLSGPNSYAGGTNLDAGVLAVTTSDTALGTGTLASGADGVELEFGDSRSLGNAVALTNSLTVDTGANTGTLGGTVSGADLLNKIGTGTLVLSGPNSYGGGTTHNGGVIRVMNDTALGGAALTASTAGVELEFGANHTLANALVLTSAMTVDTQANNGTLNGGVSGGGVFTKIGAGLLTVGGPGTLTGATNVNAGTFNLGANWGTSAFTITGARLMGTGTTGILTAGAAGRVAPGNSIGTMTAAGNVTFETGSAFEVEVDAAGQSDRLDVTGSATFDVGSAVEIQPLGSPSGFGAVTSYTILSTTTGVNGIPANVTTSISPSSIYANLVPTLSVAGNNLNLRLELNAAGFTSVLTPFVPEFVDLGQGTDLGTIIARFTDAEKNNIVGDAALAVPELFSLQPENLQNISLMAGTRQMQLALSNMGVSRELDRSLRRSEPEASHSGPLSRYAVPHVASGMFDPGDRYVQGDEGESVWFQAYYQDGRIDSFQGSAAVDHETGGFAAGYDWSLDDELVLGFTAGFADVEARRRGFGGEAQAEQYQFGLYADWLTENRFNLKGYVAYAHHDFDTARQIRFANTDRLARAKYDGRELAVAAEVGQTFGEDDEVFHFRPHLQMFYRNIETDPFAENGAGNFNLSVAGRERDIFATALGMHVYWDLGDDEGDSRVVPELTARWSHQFTGRDGESVVNLENSPVTFLTRARPLDASALQARAGVTSVNESGWEFHGEYLGDFSAGQVVHGALGSVTYRY